MLLAVVIDAPAASPPKSYRAPRPPSGAAGLLRPWCDCARETVREERE
jgi:hypothetical protein